MADRMRDLYPMKTLIKELWLALTLILAASLILLISDRGQRASSRMVARSHPSIAVMQIAATPLLDSLVAGILERLETEGMLAPDRHNLRRYNAQGDLPTANTIAREIVNSPADIVITASTLALQTFAKANLTARKTHVFGGVTNPYGAGVGISGKGPDQHPPYMAGIGTFQPVRQAFELLHEMNPAIRRVGVVWNPGEQCSEACLNEARPACRKLGIELIEATAGSTAEVSEAARALIARGVEAIWIGGDTTATAAAGLLISLARQTGIPVFTNDPADAKTGALFGLGADYFTVGQYTADVAAAIWRGKSPAAFAIENVIPEQLKLNRDVLASLGPAYRVTPAIEKRLAPGAAPAPGPLTSPRGKYLPGGPALFRPGADFRNHHRRLQGQDEVPGLCRRSKS